MSAFRQALVLPIVLAAGLTIRLTAGDTVEVKLDPLGVCGTDLRVGGARDRVATLPLNTPLMRRVVLHAEDVQDAKMTLRCTRTGPTLDPVARGTCRNGQSVSLTDTEALQKVPLIEGETLVLTVWKPAWHWHGGAEGRDLRIVRIAPDGGRISSPVPMVFENGRANTALGTFSMMGFSNRDKFPACDKHALATSGDKPGKHVVPDGKGVDITADKGTVKWFTLGRQNWDASFRWAPALVFAPAEPGTYAVEGDLRFHCGKDDHDVAWMVARYSEPDVTTLAGASLTIYRLLRPPPTPQAGVDYAAEPICRIPFTGDGVRKPVDLSVPLASVLTDALVDGMEQYSLVVGIENANGRLPDVTVSRKIAGTVTVVDHPKNVLFDHPVSPRPGVYATVRGGRLYYGDQRLRLWGVVEGGSGARNRQLGFNCLRWWHNGDLYDDASAKRGETVLYTRGDRSKADRFDQRLADVKANGMFIMFASLTGNGMPIKPVLEDGSWLHARHGQDPTWSEWRKAVLEAGGLCGGQLCYVDDWLWEIRLRHAQCLLDHVNPYTGKRYAEEEAIALYEINNEQGHLKKWIENGFDKWPPYFRASLQRQWNEWLRTRYETDAKLAEAWGPTEFHGEFLAQGNVVLAPLLADRERYPRQRQVDFITFLYELVNARNQRYREFCRALAPEGVGADVVPFSFDTMYRPSIPWLYTDFLGDTSTVSMYFWSNGTMLGSPPGLYVLDSHRLDNRLSVIYETQRGRPSPYRTEYPYILASMTDWQDFDIVVWHGAWIGDQTPEQLLAGNAMPPTTSHYWTAVHLENDPVMSAAVAMAGRLFLGGHIGIAPDPTVFTVGRKGIFSFDRFHGIGGRGMSLATFTKGSRIVLDPERDCDLLIDGVPPSPADAPTDAVRTGKTVLWDWPNERLIIDSPTAKAYVGKTVASHGFSDGITVSGFDTPFIAFSIVSADGRPLTGPDACQRAYVSAVADARNTGMVYDYTCTGGPVEQAKAIKDRGHPPVVVDPVCCTLSFPTEVTARYVSYDFAARQTGETRIRANVLRLQKQTDWMGVLEIDARGDAAKPVIDASFCPGPGETIAGAAASETTDPSRAGIPHPLPDLSWGDNFDRAARLARDAAFPKARVRQSGTPSQGTVRIEEATFLLDTPADVEILFTDARMSSIAVTFRQAPSFRTLGAKLEERYGPPVSKKLVEDAFEQSEVRWQVRRGNGALTVVATETQGVVRIAYTLAPGIK